MLFIIFVYCMQLFSVTERAVRSVGNSACEISKKNVLSQIYIRIFTVSILLSAIFKHFI